MRTRRGVARFREEHESEWLGAELVERIELLEAQVAALERERTRLETELVVARSWVKELALWLDEAQARTGGRALPATDPARLEGFLAPETIRLLSDVERPRAEWRRVLAFAALVLAPWVVIGLSAYVAWIFVS